FANFKSHFKSLWLQMNEKLDNIATLVGATLHYDKENCALHWTLAVSLEEWASLYTPAEYFRLFAAALKEISAGARFERSNSLRSGGFTLSLPILETETTISRVVKQWLPRIQDLSARASARAMESVRKDSVVTLFNFPPQVKSACEQYLVY